MRNKSISVKKIAFEMSKLAPKLIRGVRSDVFTHKEITSAQIIVLMNLYETKEDKVGHLARALGVSAPTMSGIIERMVKQGYLGRVQSQDDRRCTIISLRPKGEKVIKDFQKAVRKRWSQILVHLTPSEQLTYVRLIKKIIEAIEKSKEPNPVRDKK
jgi:DNA-binding MarR family transcriptional regulator